MNMQKIIPYLIVVVPLVLVLTASFFITTFYLEKVTTYFNSVKEQSVKEHIENQKIKSEMWTQQLYLLFDYKYNRIEESIESELRDRVDIAYKTARYIYKKYKKRKSKKEIKAQIVDALSHMRYSGTERYIFITDYQGNSIVLGNQNIDEKNLSAYLDADARSIVLEEIQKVRRRGEGFIHSRHSGDNEKEIIFVKDLGTYDWFIGSVMKVKEKEDELKVKLLDMVRSIPMEDSDFISIYDTHRNIFTSRKNESAFTKEELTTIQNSLSNYGGWHKDVLEDHYYHNNYFEPLDWNLIFGFDISNMSAMALAKQKEVEVMLEEEFEFIIKSSAAIVFFTMLLSLLLSRQVNKIFKSYQEEVEQRRKALEQLNTSLEKRVQQEIVQHRKKDKMLIQQSKMAEMGDMLNMIAHQWRQPLNQVSYIFMNIESAYEHKELTENYLEEKLQQANEQIAFMSNTIDDFRNYFRPQKEKQFVLVSDVVQSSVSLMKQSLQANNIEVETISEGRDLTHIYKNEFLQVLLNLVKNAKDVLVQNSVENPKIKISSSCYKDKLIVEVSDNGGGVDESLHDKIFEPYFSTKNKKHGTGLGLYMSKMIIEEHLDGKLSVSNTDEGACFRIEL